jgi:TPR repeat protein
VAGARWLLRAAELGRAGARLHVGKLYRSGIGVPMDPVRAHAWLNLAAASFPPADSEPRQRAVAARGEVEATLSRPQLDRALELAHQLHAQGG